jgi:hypothetical protein
MALPYVPAGVSASFRPRYVSTAASRHERSLPDSRILTPSRNRLFKAEMPPASWATAGGEIRLSSGDCHFGAHALAALAISAVTASGFEGTATLGPPTATGRKSLTDALRHRDQAKPVGRACLAELGLCVPYPW